MNWEAKKLGEIVSLQRGYDLPERKRIQGDVPVFGSAGITGWHNEAKAIGPGVTIGRSGNSFGVVNFCKQDYWPHNATLFVTDFKGNEPKFVYYLLGNVDFSAYNSGAAQPSLNRNFIYQIPLEIPPLSIQKSIVSALENYDNLIENNNRRIAILEEMAQSLYREWFVKFRFQGHDQCKMVESPLGMIPEGWEIHSIGELYKTSSGGTPSRKKPEYYGEDHWWVKTKELKDNFVISVDEKISDLGLQKSSAKLFPKHTAVIAMYGATIGRLGLLSGPAATNQACCALIQTHDAYSSWFAYLMLFFNRKKLISLGQGAAQQNISQAVIKAFTVITPPEELLNHFNSTVEPLFLSIENLSKKNNNLKTQRDLLLPKLISGQIDLNQAEQASA